MPEKASEHAKKILIAIDEIKTYREQIEKAIDDETRKKFQERIQELFQDIENESSEIFKTVGAAEGLRIKTPTIKAPRERSIPEAPSPSRTRRPILTRRAADHLPQAPASEEDKILQEKLRTILPKKEETPKATTPAKAPPAPTPIPKAPIPKPEIPSPTGPPPTPMQPESILAPELASKKFKHLSKRQKEKYIKDVKIKYEELEDFVKSQQAKKKVKVKEIKTEDFTLYKPSEIGATANKFMKKSADKLVAKYPKLFEPLFKTFLKVNMPILSRSYVSSLLFFSILAFPIALIIFFILNFAFKLNIILVVVAALVVAMLTPLAFYYYPNSLIGDRQKKIRGDLPFALVHMSAVAGSGAAPISIFELLAESDEYPELKKEIKKVLNYVNLFGYNLSNALRNVAGTTPSEELKELLNGMISTVESGGDLKAYLKEKSDDALNRYRLDRKKQVEALGTYSELYTSLLIAAPLLMVVTLAIVNTIGGQLGGVSVKLLANLGVFLGLPILNIGFMVFLNAQTSQ